MNFNNLKKLCYLLTIPKHQTKAKLFYVCINVWYRLIFGQNNFKSGNRNQVRIPGISNLKLI